MWCCLANGQHYWSGTGAEGNEFDLAGLVCNEYGNEQCINPAKGTDASRMYGDSWAKRMETITEGFDDKHEDDSTLQREGNIA